MTYRLLMLLCALTLLVPTAARADVVTDWNATLRNVIQTDGIANSPPLANPGYSTRAIAMTNGAIYDAFQAIQRTNKPFLVNASAPTNTSKTAAAAQAAHDVLASAYPLEQSILDSALANSLASVPAGQAKSDGIALGQSIASQYISNRTNDGSNVTSLWPEGTLPGQWRSDPLHAPQVAWGPSWGAVKTFAIASSQQFPVPGPPGFNTLAYTDAFNQVKDWGALNSTQRAAHPDTTDIGLFWGYDRPSMGPPPVLFVRNLEDIATAVGNSPEENARMFAMASVSMADAAIAAWDAKFAANFWRPITAIRADSSYDDDNPNTTEDPNWRPLGAPGAIANDNNPLTTADIDDDFTPPFPSYTSGHATMGGAVFQAIERFYKTNNFQQADAQHGADIVTANYDLHSQEFAGNGAANMTRAFHSFTQVGPFAPLMEDSPEGENAMSRVYLGIHWIFDQQDGTILGNEIANYVADTRFVAVPEPGSLVLGLLAIVGGALISRRRES